MGGYKHGCGPCCFLCTLFKFILSIVITLGIIVLVLWLVFRPSEIKATVEKATLTTFNLTTNDNVLSYNLTLDLSIRNPNKRISIYYNYVEARAIYDSFRFGYDNTSPEFFQGHKTTTVLHPAFSGKQAVTLGSVATTFGREKSEGWFYIDVKIYTRVKYKVWFVKTNKYSPEIDCTLKLPVPSSTGGSSSAVFSPTKCHVNMF